MLHLLPESDVEETVAVDHASAPTDSLSPIQVKLPTYILIPVTTTSQDPETEVCTTSSASENTFYSDPDEERLHIRQKKTAASCEKSSLVGRGRCKVCAHPTDVPCLTHSPMIKDHPTIPKAYASLPAELYVAQKDVRLGAYHVGVFAKTAISHPTIFGPLVAPARKSKSPAGSCFALREKSGNTMSLHVFDLDCDDLCNWMKLVRKAVDADQQNVVAFWKNSHVYFATTKDIPADTELRFWYSQRYSKFMRKGNVGAETEYVHLPEPDENAADAVMEVPEKGGVEEVLPEFEFLEDEASALMPVDFETSTSLHSAVEDTTNETHPAKETASNMSTNNDVRKRKKPCVRSKRVYFFPCTAGCKLKFQRRKSRDIHSMRHREGDCSPDQQVAECPECEFRAPALADLLDHIDNLHQVISSPAKKRSKKPKPERARQSGLFCCNYPECRYIFGTEEVRDVHALRHGAAETVASNCIRKCPECGCSAENLAELLFHVEDVHSLPKRSKRKRKHPEVVRKSCNLIRRLASCTECGLQFRTRRLLDLHMLQHTDHSHRESQNVRRCLAAGCSFSSDDIDQLLKHVDERHAQKESHYCSRCNQVFTTLKRLELHIQRIHIWSESEKRFECETCHKKFVENSSFSRHLRIHAGPNFINCCLCTATFPSRVALYDHLVENHAANGLLSCTVCDKTFQTVSSEALRGFCVHMRKHTEEGHFECQICKKVFDQVYKLKQHKLCHSMHATRDFVCECGKTFARSSNLGQHKRLAHPKEQSSQSTCAIRVEPNGENKTKGRTGYVPPQKFKSYTEFPYYCEECRQGFCRGGMLAYHFTVRHPERSLHTVPQLVMSSTAVHLNPA